MEKKRLIKIAICCFLFISLFYTYAKADIIQLKNGQRLEGNIVEEREDSVVVEVSGGRVTFYREEIETILRTEEIPKADRPLSIDSKTKTEKIEAPKAERPLSIDSKTKHEDTEKPFKKSLAENFKSLGKQDKMGVIVAIFIALISYVFYAVCYHKLALKTGTPHAWTAWVPILNIILMLNVADLSGWWLFILFVVGFLLGLSPSPAADLTINIMVVIFMAYMYLRTAANVKKPAWIGLLLLIPFVHLIVLPYLAFSK